MCEPYNGWTNRETWALMLYVSNDEGLCDMAREVCADAYQKPLAGMTDVAEALEEWATGLLSWDAYEYETGETQPAELVKMSQSIGSLYRVNWYECVETLM
jgi:hypothetical protein